MNQPCIDSLCRYTGGRNSTFHSLFTILHLPTLFFFVLALSACDNTIEPFVESQTDFFAVYGYLDTGADTQFVRVNALRPTLEAPAEAESATVTTTRDGEAAVAWRDSLVRLDDGTMEQLFYSTAPVEPGGRYRLAVQRPDGEQTLAVTRTPPRIAVVEAAVAENVTGLIQRFTLIGQQERPRGLAMRYRVSRPGAGDTVAVVLPISDSGSLSAEGLQFIATLSRDRFDVLERLGVPAQDNTTVLHGVGVMSEALSDEWSRPQNPTNIEAGFGFFGSLTKDVTEWTLEPDVIIRLGYTPPAP